MARHATASTATGAAPARIARIGPRGPGRGGQARTPEALAAALVAGKAAHAYVARIVAPFPRANRMAFLLGNLQRAWPDPGFYPGAPSLKRFSAFFDRALAKGAETQVWIQAGGTLLTREAGGPATATRDPVLATAFSGSYLGERCMDPALKADLLRELPAVLELEEMLSEKVVKGRKGAEVRPGRTESGALKPPT